MRNYHGAGDTLTLVCPSGGRASGDGVVVDAIFGVAAISADAGAEIEVKVTGEFWLPKTAGEAIGQGAPIYWDNSPAPGTASKFAPGNMIIGVATRAALAGDASVLVRLNGAFAVETET